MSDSGRGKGRLVAEQRYQKKAGQTPRKPKQKKTSRKPARRKPVRKRNPIAAFFIGIFRWVFGLIWKITWRITAVVALLLAVGVGYFTPSSPRSKSCSTAAPAAPSR